MNEDVTVAFFIPKVARNGACLCLLDRFKGGYWLPIVKVPAANFSGADFEQVAYSFLSKNCGKSKKISDYSVSLLTTICRNAPTQFSVLPCLYLCCKAKELNILRFQGNFTWVDSARMKHLELSGQTIGPEPIDFLSDLSRYADEHNDIANFCYSGDKLTWLVFSGYCDTDQQYFSTPKVHKLLRKSGFDENVQQTISAAFSLCSFPGRRLTGWKLQEFLEKLGVAFIWSDECDLRYLFRAFDMNDKAYLELNDVIVGLAAMDSRTEHGGESGPIRLKYIFRYYDRNYDGLLRFNDFKNMIRDIRKHRKQETDDVLLKELTRKEFEKLYDPNDLDDWETPSVDYGTLFSAVAKGTFRGTSCLFRSQRSLVSETVKAANEDINADNLFTSPNTTTVIHVSLNDGKAEEVFENLHETQAQEQVDELENESHTTSVSNWPLIPVEIQEKLANSSVRLAKDSDLIEDPANTVLSPPQPPVSMLTLSRRPLYQDAEVVSAGEILKLKSLKENKRLAPVGSPVRKNTKRLKRDADFVEVNNDDKDRTKKVTRKREFGEIDANVAACDQGIGAGKDEVPKAKLNKFTESPDVKRSKALAVIGHEKSGVFEATKPYDFAVHTITVQPNTGRLIDASKIWDLPPESNPLDESTQVIMHKDGQLSECQALSIDRFNLQSSAQQMLQAIRYFLSASDDKPEMNWGVIDVEILGEKVQSFCSEIENQLTHEPTVHKIESPVYVLGDLHGSLKDLLAFESCLWRLGPICSPASFLFLGDYVDRGQYGLEVILYLFAQKMIAPHKFFILRGNHEIRSIQQMFNFHDECLEKFGECLGELVWESINTCFDALPLAAIIDSNIFCAHGGIPSSNGDPCQLSEIEEIKRPMSDPENDSYIAWQLMWNDPIAADDAVNDCFKDVLTEIGGFIPNKRRGTAQNFTIDALNRFLKLNSLSHVIRAHEVKQAGFQIQQSGRLLTVFSSSDYCGFSNRAACVLVDSRKLRLIRLVF